MRKIIHIDMDAFFASVEQLDHPELRGRPVAVGYDGPRGVVATASYEARPYGVHSAMAVSTAKRLCPGLVVVGGSHARYKEVSAQMHAIFHEYTDLVEPISLDEAFLDVTESKTGQTVATVMAQEIKAKIRSRLHLTASAGVSYCKLLAKIASDMHKPDGLTTIHPSRAQAFIDSLRVEKLWGVGPRTAEALHRVGIFTGHDLRSHSESYLVERFGKMGSMLYLFARGIDTRPVEPWHERKSVGCEQTYERDLHTSRELDEALQAAATQLAGRLERTGFRGQTLTLKVKRADFSVLTRSISTGEGMLHKGHAIEPRTEAILPMARHLLSEVDRGGMGIRLMGLSVSRPVDDDGHAARWVQLELDFKETLSRCS